MTLIEVLTQRLPVWDRARASAPEVSAGVPEPFREIARHSLRVDGGERWTAGEVIDRLGEERPGSERAQSERPVPASAQPEKMASAPEFSGRKKASATWSYLLGLAAVVALAFFLISRPKPSGPTFEVQTGPGAAVEKSQPVQPSPQPSPATTSADNQNGVVRQVMPQVSPSARRTIQGTIKVRVRVDVDAAGNVAKTKMELSGPSKYFSRVATEAAREWKFVPAEAGESGAREWKLQFAFSRAKTGASATRANR
jgi:TonB family protein